ncbi:MAG: hypothetical protein ACTSWP_02960 [Candidatus Freyarchaeota archaeon]|nr:hypothetical protein [Candidatus Freyrarchaeum guaymaensis]
MLILDKEAKHGIRGKIIRILLEIGEISFRDLLVRLPVTTLDFHLRVLKKENIVEATEKGYRLRPERVQYFRDKFGIRVDVTLIAAASEEKDLDMAKEVAAKANITPKDFVYLVSPERVEKLKRIIEEMGAILLTVNSDPEKAFLEIERLVVEGIYVKEFVIDLSGSSKPLTIALMKLGEKYGLKRLYMKNGKVIFI